MVCWAGCRALHREILRRYRFQEHCLPDLIVTGIFRRPPYRERGAGRGEWERERGPIRCCIVVSEMQRSHDHPTAAAAAAAAAVTMLGGVAL